MRVALAIGCLGAIVALLLLLRHDLGPGPGPHASPGDASSQPGGDATVPQVAAGDVGEEGPRLERGGEATPTAQWTIDIVASGEDSLEESVLTLQIGDGRDTGTVNFATVGPSAGVPKLRLPWSAGQGSVQLRGDSLVVELPHVPYGQYVVLGRLTRIAGATYIGTPAKVVVGEPVVRTRIDLNAPKEQGALRVEVMRGNELVSRGVVSVYLHGEAVHRFSLETQGPEGTAVPADEELTVVLTDYPGAEELQERPEQRIRVLPGEVQTITFALRVGVETIIEPVGPTGEAVLSGLMVWRRRDSALEHVNLVSAFGDTQADRFVGLLRSGSYLLHVSPRQVLASAWAEFDVEAGQEPVIVRVPLGAREDHGRLTVRYLDSEARPLADRNLLVMRRASALREMEWTHVRTDSRGLAITRPLAPGEYRILDWSSMRFWEVRVDGAGASRDLAEGLEQETPYSATGRLHVAQGMSPGVFLLFIKRKGQPEGRFTRPDPQGVIAVRNLEEGTYEYELRTPWEFYPQVGAQRGVFAVYDEAPGAILTLRVR